MTNRARPSHGWGHRGDNVRISKPRRTIGRRIRRSQVPTVKPGGMIEYRKEISALERLMAASLRRPKLHRRPQRST